MIRCNVGTVDRVVRGLVAVITGCAGLMTQTPLLRWTLLAVATAFALSAIFAFCSIYRALGISTERQRV